MVSVVVFALTYIAGGLTFLPLCAALVFAVLFYTSPVVHVPDKTGIPPLATKAADDAEPVTVYRAGWLTVRRTYEPMKEGNGDGTYAGMLASSYRSFMDQRSRDPRRSKPKDRFFAVLKQKTLFLYEGEDQAECWAAIDVAAHDVVIFPEGNVDGELWVKRTAIELKPRKAAGGSGEKDQTANPAADEASPEDAVQDAETGEALPWFVFAKVNSDKEDWFHSLVLSSRLGYPDAASAIAQDRALFEPADMARLMEQIDQQPDSIPMRWFNALLGRVFLSAYRTSTLEDYLTSRIVRKLKRVKTPAMLSEIQVREVNVGASAPLFSKPMLKELTADGDASMEVHVAYVGGVRVTIETEATVSLGSRFKPYSVRLVLAVVLRELEGSLLVKMKQPPSNRIWFGFREIPRMALSVEPVVSTRQIKWSLVTGPIESRIRELIAESLVLPHMDDLSFFDTRAAPHSRGGIYGPFLRRERPSLEEELDAPARPDREVVTEESAEELTPGADAATSSTEEGAPRRRRPEARRRRSSEGDHPLDLTPMSASPAPEGATPTATPSAKSGAPSTSASSSSVASLATGLSASLASWREKNAASSSGASSVSSSGGAEGRRKTSWFAKSSSSATSSLAAADKLGRGESSDSLASSSASTTTEGASASMPQEEVSAAKLREILTKRAESREREKEKERERKAAAVEEEDEADAEGGEQSVLSQEAGSSNLALTASADADKSVPPAPSGDAPLPLNDPAANPPPAVASSPSKGPPLPRRASLVKTLPDPPALSSSPPTPAPSSHLAPLPSAPPPRRHSPSASVDSASGSSAAGAGTLLASWRTRATDKEALAAGVASAKESMKRWGANWAAKRAASQAGAAGGRPEDLDRPVGESPAKDREDGAGEREREAYRDYRARAASPAPSVWRAGEPRTPPRATAAAAAPGFRPAQSSLPAVQLSPSHAVGASPVKPSAGGGGGYRPVQMMALPGIKDEERRRRVREDHLGGGAGAANAGAGDASANAEVATKQTGEPANEPATADDAAEQARRNAVEAAAVVPPAPVELVEPAEPSSTIDTSAVAAVDASSKEDDLAAPNERLLAPSAASTPPLTDSPQPLDASTLPLRPQEHVETAPPPLPPRKDEAEEPAHEDKGEPPALPARPGDRAPPPPPLPPRETELGEDEADEAGWGLDDSSEAAVASG